LQKLALFINQYVHVELNIPLLRQKVDTHISFIYRNIYSKSMGYIYQDMACYMLKITIIV